MYGKSERVDDRILYPHSLRMSAMSIAARVIFWLDQWP